jgi:hypothetical protein
MGREDGQKHTRHLQRFSMLRLPVPAAQHQHLHRTLCRISSLSLTRQITHPPPRQYGTARGIVNAINLSTGKCLDQANVGAGVLCLEFEPTGRTLFVGDEKVRTSIHPALSSPETHTQALSR